MNIATLLCYIMIEVLSIPFQFTIPHIICTYVPTYIIQCLVQSRVKSDNGFAISSSSSQMESANDIPEIG